MKGFYQNWLLPVSEPLPSGRYFQLLAFSSLYIEIRLMNGNPLVLSISVLYYLWVFIMLSLFLFTAPLSSKSNTTVLGYIHNHISNVSLYLNIALWFHLLSYYMFQAFFSCSQKMLIFPTCLILFELKIKSFFILYHVQMRQFCVFLKDLLSVFDHLSQKDTDTA